MPALPMKKTITRTIHQWTINTPCDAKDFRFQVFQIEKAIGHLLGHKSEMDDAYTVSVTDDGVVISVTTDKKDKQND